VIEAVMTSTGATQQATEGRTILPKRPPDNRTIAVGVDGRPGGWQALSWAAEEAVSSGLRLVVCRCYPPGGSGAALPPDPTPDRLALADPHLAEVVAGWAARLGGDRIQVRVSSGDPLRLLRRIADQAGLMVVGAGHSYGVGSGTIASHLAAHAVAPVVAVRPTPDMAGPFAGHVVVGVDQPGPAAVAVEFAFRFADRHGLPLAAVHVGDGPTTEGGVWVDDALLETHLVVPSPGLDLLDTQVEPWHHAFPEVPVRRAVLPGHPAHTLASVVRGAPLLVLGDRGRAEPLRLLLGSVTRRMLADAPTCVAVVPPPDRGSKPSV
jgi:nucleotide-binding universal stress UspA family protein